MYKTAKSAATSKRTLTILPRYNGSGMNGMNRIKQNISGTGAGRLFVTPGA
ncbi:hypothetical protein GI364_00190 [Alicyclobacillus sp. SO9]|nr:hypothetical protein GI364_00190 [Alicyclobacillus sp. SO9]